MNINANAMPMSFSQKVLRLVGEEALPNAPAKLRWFLIFSTLVYEVEHFLIAFMHWRGGGVFVGELLLFPLLASFFVWSAWANRWLGWVLPAYAALLLVYLSMAWDGAANHTLLHVYVVVVAALLFGGEQRSAALTLQTFRWLLIAVLMGSALQKWAHGAWDAGEFFGLKIGAADQRFIALYNLLGFDQEIARYQDWAIRPGTGPYSSTLPGVIALSRGTWLAELLLPLLLLHGKTRRLGLWSIGLMMIAIESLAWEVFFGLMVMNLLFLFTVDGLTRRTYWRLALAGLVFSAIAHLLVFAVNLYDS